MTQEEFITFLNTNFPLVELYKTSGQTYFGGEYGSDQAEIRKGKIFHIFNDFGEGGPVDLDFSTMSEEDLISELIKNEFTYVYPSTLEEAKEILEHYTPSGWDFYNKTHPRVLEEFTGEELQMRFSNSTNSFLVLNPVYKNIVFNPETRYYARGVITKDGTKLYKIYNEGEDYADD